jgi:hypothetical protein
MDKENTYWALQEGQKLVDSIDDRRRDFLTYLKETTLFARIRRSYRFYHGLFYNDDFAGTNAIKIAGSDGHIRRISDNEYRAVIQLLATYIVSQRPEWDSLALASDYQTLEATKFSNQVLDSYMADTSLHCEASLAQAVIDSLVLTAGYMWTRWDRAAGEEVAPEADDKTIRYQGEFSFENPNLFHVSYDLSATDFRDSHYVIGRRKENKWDLAAQFPEVADDILELSIKNEDTDEDSPFTLLGLEAPHIEDKDHIWVDYMYHQRTPAVPEGRMVRVTNNIILEEDSCRQIPIKRIVPANYMLTCFGYSPALDSQGAQEALNANLSIFLTNANALGSNKVWTRAGEPINQADLEPGVSVIQTNTPPQSLNFLQSSPELLKGVEVYSQIIEKLSGVAAVSRGEVPPAARSGAALAMMDSRTLQSASGLIANYRQFCCEVGTSIILTLAREADEDRTIALVGKNQQRFIKEFTGEMLAPITKVAIVTGNPMMSTPAGRVEIAQFLAQTGLIRTPEEMLTVIKTGNLDRLTEHNESQLRAAQSENDTFLRGEEVETFLKIDDHAFHIKKHVAILDTPEARREEKLGNTIYAHVLQHVQALMNPQVQQLMMMLGYQLPMPTGPGGPPPGAGQAPPAKPKQSQTPGVDATIAQAQQNAQL